MKRIVIIGGMGPQASLELHRRIIVGAAAAGAQNNEDYPEIMHLSVPVTDFISSDNSDAGFAQLQKTLTDVTFKSDDLVVLACNTAHLLLPELEKQCGVKFLSLIEATVQVAQHVKRIGILASPTTIKSELYTRQLRTNGCNVTAPTLSELLRLEQVIRSVIANEITTEAYSEVNNLMTGLTDRGATQVILGCTELSVLFAGQSSPVTLDPLQIISDELVHSCYGTPAISYNEEKYE